MAIERASGRDVKGPSLHWLPAHLLTPSLLMVVSSLWSCSLQLDVVVEGDYLLGDSSLAIPARSAKAYQLIYSPLLPKKHHGSVAFLNPKVSRHPVPHTRRIRI